MTFPSFPISINTLCLKFSNSVQWCHCLFLSHFVTRSMCLHLCRAQKTFQTWFSFLIILTKLLLFIFVRLVGREPRAGSRAPKIWKSKKPNVVIIPPMGSMIKYWLIFKGFYCFLKWIIHIRHQRINIGYSTDKMLYVKKVIISIMAFQKNNSLVKLIASIPLGPLYLTSNISLIKFSIKAKYNSAQWIRHSDSGQGQQQPSF